MYLEVSLKNIDAMPQSSFDEILEKYVEMTIAHPFREGNGRSTRIWLDQIFKQELKQALTDKIHDSAIYMKGIDASYHYEGYSLYKTDDLENE